VRALAALAGAFALAAGPVTGISGRDALTGKRVDLAAWSGRPVAINVWASWCEGCKTEARALKAFERAHPGSVIGVDYQDSVRGARAFYERYDVEHPSIWDPKGRIVGKLKAIGLPSTVFLNRRHEVVLAIAGAATRAQFDEGWRRATATRR
jgi:cytochrome c biogenesis protein CcmG/thiol:disulfide interchange protein DsbE